MESKAKAIGKRADTIEYLTWIAELKKRYRATQIKAAVAASWRNCSSSCNSSMER